MPQPQRTQCEDLACHSVAGKVARVLAVRLLLLGAVLLPPLPTQAQSTPEVTTRSTEFEYHPVHGHPSSTPTRLSH